MLSSSFSLQACVYPLLIFSLLFATWAALSAKFDAFHLCLGALSAVLVTVFSQDLLFEDRKKSLGERASEAGRFVGYVFWLLWQVALANVHVFKLAMTSAGRAEMAPRVIRFKTRLKTDFGKFVFANSITLTPGTVTIRVEADEFVVHAISEAVTEDLLEAREMEGRVAAVFEPEEVA